MDKGKTNIWLDCDVGNDDSMAIILAAYHPKSNLLGISTCFGNTSLENCTNNTLKVLSTISCDHIPVFKGAEFSLKSTRATTQMHGAQGLFGVDKLVKNNDIVKDISLYDLIKKQVGENKFTIVITGPQTNIVILLKQHPEIIPQLNEIVFMGGTSGFGNVTPNAEYNIYSDPEAAQEMIDICNQNKIKLVMIALDLTYTCLVLEAQQRKIKEINTRFSDWCLQVIQEYQEAYKAQDFDFPPLHDPLAVFYALHPEFFITKPTYVVVDCESTLCYGRTVVDKKNRYQKDPTVEFGRKLDVDQFWVHMIDAIRLASSNSKIEQLEQI